MATAPAAAPPRRVVICGGGVVGACTAYFLSTHPAAPTAPTLVEKASPACAASGKAGGFLALDWCDSTPALSALARASYALHLRLSSALDGPAAYGFRPLHTLSLALSRSPSSPSASPPHPLLPSWVDASASAGPPRKLGTPNTTAQVHPALFTKAVLVASGAEVVLGEVESVVVRDGRVAGVALKGGAVVDADVVVLALGPWSGRFEMVKDVFAVSGLKAHSIVLRPREADKITPHALFLSYQPEPGGKMLDPEVYPRPTGEVYVCGMTKDEEVPDDPETIVGETESIAMLHNIAGKVSSHLRAEEGAEVVVEQACYLPCTDDGLPVIGELPGVKGCYVATGHSCWGILNGPATGAALAELILDGESKIVDLTPFSPERFLKRRRRRGV